MLRLLFGRKVARSALDEVRQTSAYFRKIEKLEKQRQKLLEERRRLIQEIKFIDAEIRDIDRQLEFLRGLEYW
jgi:chromosome segregation ATPase